MSDITWSSAVRRYLKRKLRQTETADGWKTVYEAMRLQADYPTLDGPQLIRLAYWGTPGPPSWIEEVVPRVKADDHV